MARRRAGSRFFRGAVWWVRWFGFLGCSPSSCFLTSTFSSCFGARSLHSLSYLPPFRPSFGFYWPWGGGQFRGSKFRVTNYHWTRVFRSGGARTFCASLCQNHFHLSEAVYIVSSAASRVHCLCFAAGGPYSFTRVQLWSRRCPSLHLSPACVLNAGRKLPL